MLVLSGDAGSGKTRMLAELGELAACSGAVIRATYPGYGVMGGARLAKDIGTQLGPADDADVNARMRSLAGELDPSLKTINPEGMHQEQLWAYLRILQDKSSNQPLLLAIDDMHHCDERTLELLGDIASRLGDVPLLLVLAGRSEPGEWMSRFPEATSVRLAPLGRSDAAALAGALVGNTPLAPEAAEFLAERASGNPLYLRELVAMARARSLFVEEDGCYRLAAYEAIPATLHAVLAARLDALDPRLKLGLQHVAILGEAATPERIAALGSARAEAMVRSLVDAGLLRRTGDGSYETADPLLREVAYETLPRNVRGELHRQAAATSARGDERARHLDRAAEYLVADEALAREAAEALADEGEHLAELSRHRDAIRLLERAVAFGCRRPSALFARSHGRTRSSGRRPRCWRHSHSWPTTPRIPRSRSSATTSRRPDRSSRTPPGPSRASATSPSAGRRSATSRSRAGRCRTSASPCST